MIEACVWEDTHQVEGTPVFSDDVVRRLSGNAVTKGTAEFIVQELMARRALLFREALEAKTAHDEGAAS